jgi:energy-converting hydrogenase A subunit K
MFSLIMIQTNHKGAHLSENLEKIMFFITLFIIAISFAILYTPA